MTGYAGTVHHILAVVTADNSCVYMPFTRASKAVYIYTQEHSSVYIYISKVCERGISGHTSAFLKSTQELS